MKLVKTFDTSEMTEWLFQILLDVGYFVEDGVTIYHVGDYVSEYELADPEDKKPYYEWCREG
jgi:predicted alpha-1,6-mannanase (GH76 family)